MAACSKASNSLEAAHSGVAKARRTRGRLTRCGPDGSICSPDLMFSAAVSIRGGESEVAVQIGSATPWNVAPYTAPPVRGTPAPRAGDATSSGQVAAPPGEQRRGDILAEAAGSGKADLSQRPPEEQAELAELKRRDQEVRQHEAAHVAAGGAYVRGGASYSYQPGPDGKRYAVGGEVSIDASPVGDNPEATIAKMQRVRGAALAPANPSGQDLAGAARASQTEMQARMQAAARAQQSTREGAEASSATEDDSTPSAAPSSPADTVGSMPVAAGSWFDSYA